MAVWKSHPPWPQAARRAQARRADAPDRAQLGELALEAGSPPACSTSLRATARPGRRCRPSRRRQGRVHRLDRRGAGDRRPRGPRVKRVTLELGGKSPNIMLPDADVKRAVKGAFTGIYYNSGQACNAGVADARAQGDVRRVVARWRTRPAGQSPGPAWTRIRSSGRSSPAEQHERVSGYIDVGRSEAELVAGGKSDFGNGGYYVEPTVFTTTDDGARIVREEIFGPVLVAQPYESLEEVARRANAGEYGLAAGVWTRESQTRTASPPAARRVCLRQRLGHRRPGSAVRRLQGLGRRPRARRRWVGRVPGAEVGLRAALDRPIGSRPAARQMHPSSDPQCRRRDEARDRVRALTLLRSSAGLPSGLNPRPDRPFTEITQERRRSSHQQRPFSTQDRARAGLGTATPTGRPAARGLEPVASVARSDRKSLAGPSRPQKGHVSWSLIDSG